MKFLFECGWVDSKVYEERFVPKKWRATGKSALHQTQFCSIQLNHKPALMEMTFEDYNNYESKEKY